MFQRRDRYNRACPPSRRAMSIEPETTGPALRQEGNVSEERPI